MRFLKYLLIAMLLIVGCGKEPKVFEQGGKTYYQDSSGELYILVGTKKVKVEDYVEPPKKEEPEFVDTKSFTRTWIATPYNFKVDLNLRYLDGLMWIAEIKDVEGKALHETKYGKRLGRRIEANLLTLRLESSDRFNIQDINVQSSNCNRVVTKDGKLDYYECKGKNSSVSKQTFSLIGDLNLRIQIRH